MFIEMSIGTDKMSNLRCYHDFFAISQKHKVNYGKLYISLIGNGYVAKIKQLPLIMT
jgi:hypothetical protein